MTGLPSRIGSPWQALRTADFPRVLAARQHARGPHFALHHLPAAPEPVADRAPGPVVPELSTASAPIRAESVHDLPLVSQNHWFGLVVPKRHAKRSVTRSLLKRQMREVMLRNRSRLPPGLWLLRLRAPFDPLRFPSAASQALRQAARLELDAVLGRVLPAPALTP